MKLHTKLILFLLCGLVVIISAAQTVQYFSVSRLISALAESSVNLIRKGEEEKAKNIFKSVEQAVAGSLERGEMEKFSRLIQDQREIEGLLEFSLFDIDGVVSHSSDAAFINNKMTDDVKKKLSESLEMVLTKKKGVIEIYQPQIINSDCIRCHTRWKEGAIGGTTHFRFSTEALTLAEKQAGDTISQVKRDSFRNSIISIFGVIAVMVMTMYILVKKLVGKPLGEFVELLQLFESAEGDLTKRIPLKTKDEIGTLAKLFNSFIEYLNKIISSAQKRSKIVGEKTDAMAKAVKNTTGKVDEISTMTNLNAKNAVEANSLIKHANTKAEEAASSMVEVKTCIEEISDVSEETISIIKTIDEVAFQTNLLALNASVEAARAGEAGAGFAVVADEVRNLAVRSAEAAKKTDELITRSEKKINQGVKLVQKASEAFSDVTDNSGKATELMNEISSDSEEQARSITEIAGSLKEMDQTTHDSAKQAKSLYKEMAIFKT